MFMADRQRVIDAVATMGTACCQYSNKEWARRCDCKYGVTEGKWPTAAEAGNGCPELRAVHRLLSAMTDDEWTLLSRRAGGVNLYRALFGSHDLAGKLHAADAAAAMAQDQIAQVRAALAADSASDEEQQR